MAKLLQNFAPSARPIAGRRAMTLMELLVVAAVIAILTALVWSAVTLVRRSATQVACLSNLQQCALNFTAYASENRNRLPQTPGYANNPDMVKNLNGSLISSMGTYFQTWRAWSCPAVGKIPLVDNLVANTGDIRSTYSYWPGAVSEDAVRGSLLICPTKLTQMVPSNLLMEDLIYYGETDGLWRVNHSVGGTRWQPYSYNPSLTSFRGGSPRGMNALFGDLRGKWIVYNDTVTCQPLYRYVSPSSAIFTTPGPRESIP